MSQVCKVVKDLKLFAFQISIDLVPSQWFTSGAVYAGKSTLLMNGTVGMGHPGI